MMEPRSRFAKSYLQIAHENPRQGPSIDLVTDGQPGNDIDLRIARETPAQSPPIPSDGTSGSDQTQKKSPNQKQQKSPQVKKTILDRIRRYIEAHKWKFGVAAAAGLAGIIIVNNQ